MFHVYYPPLLFLALFIVAVIVILLRYGPKFLKTRHTTLPPQADWYDVRYEAPAVSFA